jgi:hypothetical protein
MESQKVEAGGTRTSSGESIKSRVFLRKPVCKKKRRAAKTEKLEND